MDVDRDEFYIGRRLSYGGDLCTIRYFGPVAGTTGDWLGIEWDDIRRGKHDGTHEGVRYFECLDHSPFVASFVRPNKKLDPSVKFLAALHDRYAGEDASKEYRGNINWGGKIVEEIGFDKIRQKQSVLEELRVIILDRYRISGRSISSDEEWKTIGKSCRRVVEVGLSYNLLQNWHWVESLCSQLPDLRQLRLDGNRFLNLSTDAILEQEPPPELIRLEDLSLNYTWMNWEEIENATKSFPNLLSLSLGSNMLSSMCSNKLPRTLKELNLAENSFETFDSLKPLKNLACLENLSLRSNRLRSISDSPEDFVLSESIITLNVGENSVSQWAFVDALSTILPALSSLIIVSNPLFEGGGLSEVKQTSKLSAKESAEESFLLVTARLGNLEVLNSSKIKPEDRQNAELHYLSTIAAALSASPISSEPSILVRHPRWPALCAQHGAPTILRSTSSPNAVSPNSLASHLLLLTLDFPSPAQAALGIDKRTLSVRVPRSWDLYKVKAHVGRQLGCPGGAMLQTRMVLETSLWEPDRGGGKLNTYAQWEFDDEAQRERAETQSGKGRWVTTEEEMRDGLNPVGMWIDGAEGRVRIEVRDGFG